MAKRRALGLLLCLLLLLCTACGGQTQEDAGALHCTVKITCSTVLEHMDDLKPGKDMADACGVDFIAAGWAHRIPRIVNYMKASGARYCESVAELDKILFEAS